MLLTEKSQLLWLCDQDSAVLEAASKFYPDAKTTTDISDVINDDQVEAVAVATPTSTHYQVAKQLLNAGKHVLVEKPITMTSGEADELTKLAEDLSVILMVGHVFMFNDGLRYVKDLITSGEIGDVYYLALERTNLGPVRTDVNVLWDLVSHDISIITDLMNMPPDAVSANGQSFLNSDVEDVVFATFSFDSGVRAHIHASWLNPKKVRQITVVGSKKMVIWDDLNLQEPVRIINKRVEFPAPGSTDGSYITYKTICVDGGAEVPQISMKPPLQNECEHFLDCILEEKRPISDGSNGAAVVRILEAATESLKSGTGEFVRCFND